MVLLEAQNNLKIGDNAPEFSLKGTDGAVHTLSKIKGKKATLVVFMCNHCPYVIPKIPELERIQNSFDEVAVIGINANDDTQYPEDSFDNMVKLMNNYSFLYLHDPNQEIANAYGAVCTPDPFLFNEENKLIFRGRIDNGTTTEGTDKELFNAIEEYLKTGSITAPQNPSRGCSIKWK